MTMTEGFQGKDEAEVNFQGAIESLNPALVLAPNKKELEDGEISFRGMLLDIGDTDLNSTGSDEGDAPRDPWEKVPLDDKHSPLFMLQDADIEAHMNEQQALQNLYTALFDATHSFVEPMMPKKGEKAEAGVYVAENSESLFARLSIFMNQVKDVLLTHKISSDCNLVKLIDGLRHEFLTIHSFGRRYGTINSEMVKTKLDNLVRVLMNLSTAIQVRQVGISHNGEGTSWKEFDAYMPDILGVTAISYDNITELELELASNSTHNYIIMMLPELQEKMEKPAPYQQAKLDKYAQGDLSIHGINEEKAAWIKIQTGLQKLQLESAASKKLDN